MPTCVVGIAQTPQSQEGVGIVGGRPMKILARSGRVSGGFTLLELAIVLVVGAILVLLAMPSYSRWINNSKVRSVAEAVQNGIRAAQTEALRRGRQTAFVLTNSAPAANAAPSAKGINWYIQVLPLFADDTINAPFVEGGSFGSRVSGVTVSGAQIICFNSMGRLVDNNTTTASIGANCAAPVPPANVTYDLTSAGADRTLEIQVQLGGQIRMCDKSRTLSLTNPDGC